MAPHAKAYKIFVQNLESPNQNGNVANLKIGLHFHCHFEITSTV